MESVVLNHITGEPFHCPFCGHQTLDNKQFELSKSKCQHLLYLGTSECGLEYKNIEVKEFLREYLDSGDEDDLIAIKMENAIHFSLCEPAPSAFGVFIGYKKD